MSDAYIDLHTHSIFSDGSLSPTELVHQASKSGLAAIALTDHDTTAGIHEALTAAQPLNLEVIPGIECSSFMKGSLHILGYFIQTQDTVFQDTLHSFAMMREKRNRAILENLEREGILCTMQELQQEAQSSIITRAHIAACLLKKSYVRSYHEAFTKYIGDEGVCFVARVCPHPQAVIQAIHDNGAVAVLAHPMLTGLKTEQECYQLLARLKELGLDGVEVYHSQHSLEWTGIFARVARQLSLLSTGGSDYHGAYKPEVFLGRGRNNLSLPYALLDAMKEYRAQRGGFCRL